MFKRKHESIGRLGIAMLGLLLVGVLVESRGLAVWSDRLEVGPYRNVAMKLTHALSFVSEFTHIPGARTFLIAKVNKATEESADVKTICYVVPKAFVPVEQVKISVDLEQPKHVNEKHIAVVADVANPVVIPLAVNKQITIALVGDSMMAVGLGPFLSKTLSSDSVKVVKAYKCATGLVRLDVYNWMEELPKILNGRKADIVICAIGANDGQGCTIDGRSVNFGTDKWVDEYTKRVGSFVGVMGDKLSTKVLWVSLPKMRSDKFSRTISKVNETTRNRLMSDANVTILDSNPLLGGTDGSYVEFVKNSTGQLRQVRATDGIHMSEAGAERVGLGVIEWLRSNANVGGI